MLRTRSLNRRPIIVLYETLIAQPLPFDRLYIYECRDWIDIFAMHDGAGMQVMWMSYRPHYNVVDVCWYYSIVRVFTLWQDLGYSHTATFSNSLCPREHFHSIKDLIFDNMPQNAHHVTTGQIRAGVHKKASASRSGPAGHSNCFKFLE